MLVLLHLLLVIGRPPLSDFIHARSSRVKRPAIRWSAFRAGWGQQRPSPLPLLEGPALGKLLVDLEGRKVIMTESHDAGYSNASFTGGGLFDSAASRAAATVATRLPPSQVLELHANGSQRQMRTDYASILQQLQLSVRDLRMLRSHAAEIVVHESRIVYDLGELKVAPGPIPTRTRAPGPRPERARWGARAFAPALPTWRQRAQRGWRCDGREEERSACAPRVRQGLAGPQRAAQLAASPA